MVSMAEDSRTASISRKRKVSELPQNRETIVLSDDDSSEDGAAAHKKQRVKLTWNPGTQPTLRTTFGSKSTSSLASTETLNIPTTREGCVPPTAKIVGDESKNTSVDHEPKKRGGRKPRPSKAEKYAQRAAARLEADRVELQEFNSSSGREPDHSRNHDDSESDTNLFAHNEAWALDALWRTFTPVPSAVHKVTHLKLSCHRCGLGHIAGDCPLTVGQQRGGGFTWTRANAILYSNVVDDIVSHAERVDLRKKEQQLGIKTKKQKRMEKAEIREEKKQKRAEKKEEEMKKQMKKQQQEELISSPPLTKAQRRKQREQAEKIQAQQKPQPQPQSRPLPSRPVATIATLPTYHSAAIVNAQQGLPMAVHIAARKPATHMPPPGAPTAPSHYPLRSTAPSQARTQEFRRQIDDSGRHDVALYDLTRHASPPPAIAVQAGYGNDQVQQGCPAAQFFPPSSTRQHIQQLSETRNERVPMTFSGSGNNNAASDSSSGSRSISSVSKSATRGDSRIKQQRATDDGYQQGVERFHGRIA